VLVDEYLRDLGQDQGPGKHAEHLHGIEPRAGQHQDERHQDHQADTDDLGCGDCADGPGQRCQRAGAVMRGDVPVDTQAEAGHRAGLRQYADKQDQDTKRHADEQPGQAVPVCPGQAGIRAGPPRSAAVADWA